jgi:hypothetical protein
MRDGINVCAIGEELGALGQVNTVANFGSKCRSLNLI